jgi:hypothetical protein
MVERFIQPVSWADAVHWPVARRAHFVSFRHILAAPAAWKALNAATGVCNSSALRRQLRDAYPAVPNMHFYDAPILHILRASWAGLWMDVG